MFLLVSHDLAFPDHPQAVKETPHLYPLGHGILGGDKGINSAKEKSQYLQGFWVEQGARQDADSAGVLRELQKPGSLSCPIGGPGATLLNDERT